jgi:glycerol-3-phosphate dehydrogenase
MEHVIIIGGGGTGAALAHDLTLRGFKVSLIEKGALLSGTSGRHHGLLHSGARYAVHDPVAAQECIVENRILRQIAPASIEQNDGLFVAIDDADLAYKTTFLQSCNAHGIPTREITPEHARAIEPALNPELQLAVQVPDATMDAWRLPLQFLATAKAKGADIHHFSEVIGIHQKTGVVTGVQILDHKSLKIHDLQGDMVVNATGAWSGKISAMVDINVPIQPAPGVMVALNSRLTHMVINRLQPAGQGDILVPQRRLSIIGTSFWLADDPDVLELPRGHVQKMVGMGAELVPAAQHTPIQSAWLAVRPLLGNTGANNAQPTGQYRGAGFNCRRQSHNHAGHGRKSRRSDLPQNRKRYSLPNQGGKITSL